MSFKDATADDLWYLADSVYQLTDHPSIGQQRLNVLAAVLLQQLWEKVLEVTVNYRPMTEEPPLALKTLQSYHYSLYGYLQRTLSVRRAQPSERFHLGFDGRDLYEAASDTARYYGLASGGSHLRQYIRAARAAYTDTHIDYQFFHECQEGGLDRTEMCHLAREIIPCPAYELTPLTPVQLAWGDGTIPRLLKAVRPHEQASYAILADALEEAGYQDGNILAHLRDQKVPPHRRCPHHHHCWAVEHLLGIYS